MRRGLVGHQIRTSSASARARHDLWQQLGRITQQSHRHSAPRSCVSHDPGQRIVEITCLLIQIARAQPKIDSTLLALDDQGRRAGEARRQRLRAPHTAQASAQNPAPRKISTEMLSCRFCKRLIGALHNALSTDVDPGSRRHLPEHHQTRSIELVKVLPGGPARHQIGVGDQHPRRILMGTKHTDGFARLNQQGLVGCERFEGLEDSLEAIPVSRCLADPAVHHQGLGILCDLGIQIVLNHPPGALDQPVAAMQGAAAGSTNDPGLRKACLLGRRRHVGEIRHSNPLFQDARQERGHHPLQSTLTRFASTHCESARRFGHTRPNCRASPRSVLASDPGPLWLDRQ